MDRVQRKKKMMSIPFPKCPICDGDMVEKEIEKVLRGGNNTAVIVVHAEICLKRGEHLYSEETIRRFDEIRDKLAREETNDFMQLGITCKVG